MDGGGNNIVKIIFVRHGESTKNVATKKGLAYDLDNVILTDRGILQAKTTVKYLFNTYGKFDRVYSSPKTRCVQTSNLIMNQINFNSSKIIIDDNIIEIGGYVHTFGGLSNEERDKIMEKKIQNLIESLDKIKNPFEKELETEKTYKMLLKKYPIKPDLYEASENIDKFFNKLKKIINQEKNIKKILVVTHGGIIDLIQHVLSGVNVEKRLYISEKIFENKNELLGNCACLSVGYDNDKFRIVSPANTYHLNKLNTQRSK